MEIPNAFTRSLDTGVTPFRQEPGREAPKSSNGRSGRGGRRQNPIHADHVRRSTGLAMVGLLDYRDCPRCSLHSPRTERMTEKSAVTPSARSAQMKKKAPLDLAITPPTPAPFMWMTGTPDPRSDPRRMMTYPDRRS